jgi:hypothetical protein
MTRYYLPMVITLAVSGCASNVEARYPSPAGPDQSGSVVIRFSEPMRAVSVSIDGLLVAEDEHTERVRITDVPSGPREVSVVAAAGGRTTPVDRSETLNVTAGQEASMLVPVPPRSLGRWIWSAAHVLSYAVIIIASDWWQN